MFQLMEEIFRKASCGTVYNDNQGAIFLIQNWQVSQRTKHIYFCQLFA